MPATAAVSSSGPIGVLDSGVGGLSIVRALSAELPSESIVYVADQAHLPYGPRPLEEIRAFVHGIADFLLAGGAKLIVVACNAASAASLHYLRAAFPDVPFVGMEPAVKPAASATHSGVVGVLTTAATADGPLYASVRDRFARGVAVETLICPELVLAVEANRTTLVELRPVFDRVLAPALARGADQIVLACTHFPFALDAIRAYAGPGIEIVDPSPAIARQARRVLTEHTALATNTAPDTQYYTTGDPARFAEVASSLLRMPIHAEGLAWQSGRLVRPAIEDC